jgi:hypothetical protein
LRRDHRRHVQRVEAHAVDQPVGQRVGRHAGLGLGHVADAAVAVQEGVDGLELHVGQRGPQQRAGGLGVVVQNALEGGQAIVQPVGWRRHEHGIAGPRAAQPHLGAAELARCLAVATRVVPWVLTLTVRPGGGRCMWARGRRWKLK